MHNRDSSDAPSSDSSGAGINGHSRARLRILSLNYEFPPIGGGAGNATRHTAEMLARRGHFVHVLTSKCAELPAEETVGGVTVFRVRSLRRSMLECGLIGAASYIAFAFFELVRLAKIHRYDVYQVYFGLPTGLLALYVHFVLRKPYVLALRGSDVPGYDDNTWYMRPLHLLLRPLSCFLWRRASAVTVLSQSLKGLAEATCPDVQCLTIPNGIDTAAFTRSTRPFAHAQVRLLTVCRTVQRKGLHFLVEAMRELKQEGLTLEIVGNGQHEPELRRLVREFGLEDWISMPGYVPREELASHYARADIFVLPSLSESFGQVLLEAMSCGLPIIATRVGGIPETVRQDVNGLLIPPRDSGAIVDAVRHLCRDPALRARMGRHNAEYVREHCSWSAIADQYERLYMRALGRDEQSMRTLGTHAVSAGLWKPEALPAKGALEATERRSESTAESVADTPRY